MQQIYGMHRVRGRGQIVRALDGGNDRRVELTAVEADEFSVLDLDGSLILRPEPQRAADLPWREFDIPPWQIDRDTFARRSLLWLRFVPGGHSDPGVSYPASLQVSIWTDAFDTLIRVIAGQPDECELSFVVTSYGQQFGDWACGHYGAFSGGPGTGARTLVFGPAEFKLSRRMLTVNQRETQRRRGWLRSERP